jgi:hypothetical protein
MRLHLLQHSGIPTSVAKPRKNASAFRVGGRRRLGRTAQMYLTASYLPNGYVQ